MKKADPVAFMVVGATARGEIPDGELVRRFQETGDQECFLALFTRYQRTVYGSCRCFFENAEAAEDATQEAFLRAFQNLHRFVDRDFAGWILRIARNVCIDQFRRRRREEALEEAEATPSPGPSVEHAAGLRLAAEKVLEQMEQLPADQRRCLELIIEGHSYQEMAAITTLSVEAVRSNLQNGRRTLWQRLGKVLAGLK